MKVRIESVKTRVSESGQSLQAIRLQVVSLDGRRFFKEAWIPVERGTEPYAVGRYEVSERSVYVNRSQGVGFFPRLDFVSDLEDDSLPEVARFKPVEAQKPAKGNGMSDEIPF